jgi:hypothetical protein
MMKDTFCRRFFLEPTQTLHRRYEALRAVFVDQQPQTDVAKRFGYTYATLRCLVSDFRAQCRTGQAPPFSLLHSTGDLLGHTMAINQLAWTKLSGRMYVGCHCSQDAAYVLASLAFSSFSHCWLSSSSINS